MNILNIESSPRTGDSNSRALTAHLLSVLQPAQLIVRDLAQTPLPTISAEDLVALHGGLDSDRASLKQHRDLSDQLIAELKTADTLVIGVAMHNFTVPAVLKQWIDRICRADETFRYTADGPEGLTAIDNAYIVVATGGTPIGSDMDFASGYVAHICRFIGVRNVHIIDASGSKRKTDEILAAARQQIEKLVAA
jgi:Acyl carrier protein phosphodiesterase